MNHPAHLSVSLSALSPQPAGSPSPSPALAGDSQPIRELRLRIQRIAPHLRHCTVYATCSEGAMAVARAIHDACDPFAPFQSMRATGPAERELALAERWDRGTLVIEEIASFGLPSQAALLKVLEHRARSLRQSHSIRILATTTRAPQVLLASGQLLAGLQSRLGAGLLRLPSLSERYADLPAIAYGILGGLPGTLKTLDAASLDLLAAHPWEGDITELRQVLTHAHEQSATQTISADTLREAMRHVAKPSAPAERTPERLQAVIDRHVLAVLELCAGNKVRASELLGISRSTLYRMLDALAVT